MIRDIKKNVRWQHVGVRCQVIACQVVSIVDTTIQENSTDKGIWYRYRRSVQIQESDTVLKSSISKDLKLFTTIKKRIIVKLSSMQAGKQVKEHPSKAKQAGAKLMHSTRHHHARRG